MFDFLAKLSFNRGTNISLIIFGTLLAPYWFLFQFAQDVYKNNSIIQTLILALAIGVPISLIIYAINLTADVPDEIEGSSEQEKINKIFSVLGISCLSTAFILYVPCAFKYIKPEINQHSAIAYTIAIFAGLNVRKVIVILFPKKKKKQPVIQPNSEGTK